MGRATDPTRSSANEIESDKQAAEQRGFTGTPSFLIGKTGGTMGKLEYSSLDRTGWVDEAIEKLLQAPSAMSARALRTTLIVLTTIGLGVAGYLSYVHYSGAAPVCAIKGNS